MRIRELSELGACRVPELRQMQPCTPALGVLLSRERTGSQPTSESTALLPSMSLLPARQPSSGDPRASHRIASCPEIILISASLQPLWAGAGERSCRGQLAPGEKQGESLLKGSHSPLAPWEVALSWKALWLYPPNLGESGSLALTALESHL